MKYKIDVGDYFQLKNKDYCVVLEFFMRQTYEADRIKFRVVKSCKGKYSEKSRIGKPYTYQLSSCISHFKKRILRKISHEEILTLLFKQRKPPFPIIAEVGDNKK